MKPKPSIRLLSFALALLWAVGASAQVTPGSSTPPTPAFDITGFIQEATLDTTNSVCTPADPVLAGGTMTLNGIKMIVPCNNIIQMPATFLTWAQIFNDPTFNTPINPIGVAPLTHPTTQTGFALTDTLGVTLERPFPSFEVRAVGNIVPDPLGGPPRYIVGLIVPITQELFNISAGIVSFIDYSTGSFRVGGKIPDANCVQGQPFGGPSCSGAAAQFNDPVGRFGLPHSPDPRFTADTDNPTIHASSGYPVCIPRTLPPANYTDPINDAECPHTNRPLNGDPHFPVDPFLAAGAPLKTFDMPPSGTSGVLTDQTKQVPMMVGDWVDYSGTLFKIDPAGPATAANSYISVHTLEDNLGIFTTGNPSYVFVESALLGTGGAGIPNIATEATTRIFITTFTTDPTRDVQIFAKDVNPCTGEVKDRPLVTIAPLTLPLTVRGRARLILPGGGPFMPPTREMKAKIVGTPAGQIAANGLKAGEFSLPNFDFIGPERIVRGQPMVPMNFQDFPFLAMGSGPLDGFGGVGPILGQLDPWPGDPAPKKVICSGGAVPIANAGGDIVVGAGAAVTLLGTAILDPNSVGTSFAWTQTAGQGVSPTGANTATLSFTAPFVPPNSPPQTLTFQLAVSDQFGTGTDTVNVKVLALTDTLTATATWRPAAKKSGFKLNVTATSTIPTANLTVREFNVNGNRENWGVMNNAAPPPGSFAMNVKGAPPPARILIRSNFGGAINLNCGAPNAAGRITCN
jgi:hypothetical protein